MGVTILTDDIYVTVVTVVTGLISNTHPWMVRRSVCYMNRWAIDETHTQHKVVDEDSFTY